MASVEAVLSDFLFPCNTIPLYSPITEMQTPVRPGGGFLGAARSFLSSTPLLISAIFGGTPSVPLQSATPAAGGHGDTPFTNRVRFREDPVSARKEVDRYVGFVSLFATNTLTL